MPNIRFAHKHGNTGGSSKKSDNYEMCPMHWHPYPKPLAIRILYIPLDCTSTNNNKTHSISGTLHWINDNEQIFKCYVFESVQNHWAVNKCVQNYGKMWAQIICIQLGYYRKQSERDGLSPHGMEISEIKCAQAAKHFSIEFIVCGCIQITCTKQRVKQEDSEAKSEIAA